MQASPGQADLADRPGCALDDNHGKDTGIVGYNVQAAGDTEHHLIVVHEVTNVETDRRQLANVAGQAWKELCAEMFECVAGRGDYEGGETEACADACARQSK